MFTNGHYDPWSAGGITTTLNDKLPAIFMEGSAHHLDLFFSNPADPASVVAARKVQMNNVADWLAQRHSARMAAKTATA